jgi:hypothetical protein
MKAERSGPLLGFCASSCGFAMGGKARDLEAAPYLAAGFLLLWARFECGSAGVGSLVKGFIYTSIDPKFRWILPEVKT